MKTRLMVKAIWRQDWPAQMKLMMLNNARTINDLRASPKTGDHTHRGTTCGGWSLIDWPEHMVYNEPYQHLVSEADL